MFRKQLNVNSELQKENDQFVSFLITNMNFNFSCFTGSVMHGPYKTPQSFQKLGLRCRIDSKV